MQTPTTRDDFLAAVFTLCTIHGGSVTSWIRTPTRNRMIGGSPQSFHLAGYAVDVVLDNKGEAPGLLRDCKALGLQAIDEGDHIHIEADNAVTRLARG